MWPRNALTDRLNIRWPILQAPMGWLSTPALAAAVSNAGGLGGLGLGVEVRVQLIPMCGFAHQPHRRLLARRRLHQPGRKLFSSPAAHGGRSASPHQSALPLPVRHPCRVA
jgi:NAD(P)H-dependent flavin oxidoreductase YrpB (nitropropane dioxygenase family)